MGQSSVDQPPERVHPQSRRIKSHEASLLAWLVVGSVNAVAIGWLAPYRSFWIRLGHHVYDLGHTLAIALACSLAIAGWNRMVSRRPAAGYAAVAVCSLVIAAFVASEDLEGIAQRRVPFMPAELLLACLVTGVALTVPSAAVVALGLSHVHLRFVPFMAGVAVAVLNETVYPHDSPGLHTFLVLGSAALVWGSLVGAPLPNWRGGRASGRGNRHLRRFAMAAMLGLATFCVVVPPSNAVLRALLWVDGSLLPPFLSRAWRYLASRSLVPVESPWFVDRGTFEAIAPDQERLLPNDAVVVLVSIESARVDVFEDPSRARQLPTLFALRDRSVWFSQARSPGSSTVYSLSSLSMGTYFSQQYWVRKPHEKQIWVWPHRDDAARFTELLQQHGIRTVHFSGLWWFLNEWGVMRGFSEESLVDAEGSWSVLPGEYLVDPVIERLESHQQGPLFLFVHVLDPHEPYTLAGDRGSPFESYVAEIARVDRQIARIVLLLEEKFPRRGALLIMGDHGESFGEHGLTAHSRTIYEENLRIPMLAYIPGIPARRIAQPVSVVDLGPTILDLFGIATPGHFMGQSLVKLLRGDADTLTRPIVAETRLKQAMVFPDGYKAIRDLRTGVLELYDLARDPGEQHDLFDEDDPEALRRIGILEYFFDVHTNRRAGYTVPFRR